MKPETLQLYTTRYEEKYDIEIDELYVVWSKLKQLSLEDKPTTEPKPSDKKDNPLALLPKKQQEVSSIFLTYPDPIKLPSEEKQCLVCLSTYRANRSLPILQEKKLQKPKKKMRTQGTGKKEKRRKRNVKRKRRSSRRERKCLASIEIADIPDAGWVDCANCPSNS